MNSPNKSKSRGSRKSSSKKSSEWEDSKFRRVLGEKLRQSPEGRKAQPTDEYEEDILEFLRQKEITNRINPDFLSKNKKFTDKMRKILVEWIVEVCEEYFLDIKTLHLAVSIFDRFGSLMPIQQSNAQILMCASLLIASKFEVSERSIRVDDLVYISDNSFNRQNLIEAETIILKALDYRVSFVTCIDFAQIFHDILSLTDKQKMLSKYVMDLSLIFTDVYEYKPSLVAAASIGFALYVDKNMPVWTPNMEKVTGYTFDEIFAVFPSILKWLSSPIPQTGAIKRLYSKTSRQKVSEIPIPEIK